jgi:hypothetical protein
MILVLASYDGLISPLVNVIGAHSDTTSSLQDFFHLLFSLLYHAFTVIVGAVTVHVVLCGAQLYVASMLHQLNVSHIACTHVHFVYETLN